MNQSPRKQPAPPGPGSSREEVQQWFAEAFAASGESGARPELDSFLASLSEPDRSHMRQELEAMARSDGRDSLSKVEGGGDQTANHIHLPARSDPAKGGTAEFLARNNVLQG